MRAMWTHIAHTVMIRIGDGSGGFDGLLPSGRALGDQFGVSAPVASRVMRFLCAEGIAIATGRGVYVVAPGGHTRAAAEAASWVLSNGYWTRPPKPGVRTTWEVVR